MDEEQEVPRKGEKEVPLTPKTAGASTWLPALVASAIVALASLGGNYLIALSTREPHPSGPHYELWAPPGMPVSSGQLFVYCIETTSGKSWRLARFKADEKLYVKWIPIPPNTSPMSK